MAGFSNDVMYADNVDFTGNAIPSAQMTSDGQLIIGSGSSNPQINTLTAGTGMTITNGPGTITLATTAHLTDLHTAKFIVSSQGTSGTGANYTTITAAISAAVSTGLPSTIFIMPGLTGVYTEDFTLPANINLTSYPCDAQTPTVTIKGTILCTDAGSRTISNIRLRNNNVTYILSAIGGNAVIVNFVNCYFLMQFQYAINYQVSNAASQINLYYCTGDTVGTAATLFTMSSTGTLTIEYCDIRNTGGSSTVSTASAGTLRIFYSLIGFSITTSGTSAFGSHYSFFEPNVFGAANTTAVTYGGSGSQSSFWDSFNSGSASAISVSGTLQIQNAIISSSNTNVITGAGTIIYGALSFSNNGKANINTTTQTVLQSYNTIPRTATSTTPYTVLSTDYFIAVDASGGAKQVNLPNAPSLNQVFIVKDANGNAAANNITVTTPGGAVLLDAAATYVIAINYGSAQFVWNGVKYHIF